MERAGSTVTGVRKPIVWTVAVLALVAVVIGTTVVVGRAGSSAGAAGDGAECTVPLAGGLSATPPTDPAAPVPVYLDAVQLQHASTINAVGMARGLPARARVIALATAYQESQLRNLPNGDRDSVGLFQQRPSQGWGTAQQVADPVYAAGKFYDALQKVAGWQTMALTKAAQSVQFSGFPDAYAKWEGQAVTLAAALGGATPIQLSCRADAQPPTAAAPQREPLTGTAGAPSKLTAVLAAAQAELRGLTLLGLTGSTAVVRIGLPGRSAAAGAQALAAWAVAHSTGSAVAAVSVGQQRWSDHAWSTAAVPAPAGTVAITIG